VCGPQHPLAPGGPADPFRFPPKPPHFSSFCGLSFLTIPRPLGTYPLVVFFCPQDPFSKTFFSSSISQCGYSTPRARELTFLNVALLGLTPPPSFCSCTPSIETKFWPPFTCLVVAIPLCGEASADAVSLLVFFLVTPSPNGLLPMDFSFFLFPYRFAGPSHRLLLLLRSPPSFWRRPPVFLRAGIFHPCRRFPFTRSKRPYPPHKPPFCLIWDVS